MSIKVFISIFFLSGMASAKSLICDLANESGPQNWPKEQISIIHNEKNIETVDYVAKIPSGDGTFKDKIERIYSRTYSDSFKGAVIR